MFVRACRTASDQQVVSDIASMAFAHRADKKAIDKFLRGKSTPLKKMHNKSQPKVDEVHKDWMRLAKTLKGWK